MNALETERVRSPAVTFFFDTYNWIFDRTRRTGIAKQLKVQGIWLIFLNFAGPSGVFRSAKAKRHRVRFQHFSVLHALPKFLILQVDVGNMPGWSNEHAGWKAAAAGAFAMKWNALEEQNCSMARTIAVIGDRWTLLILRECFLRVRRFEEFQDKLGITRHLLAARLKKLVQFGVLRRAPYQESPKRHEYILTQKGLDLYPIIMAIVHWGDVHMVDERGRPILHQHKACGKFFDPVMVCSECAEPLRAKDVVVHRGPGAAAPAEKPLKRAAQLIA